MANRTTTRSRKDGFSIAAVWLVLALFLPPGLAAQDVQVPASRPVLATTDFELVGFSVDVEPAHQEVPKHTATGILTRIATPNGQALPEGGLVYDARYKVRGELVGPSLSSPLALETEIGRPLVVPPLALPGDYLVINLRVIDTEVSGAPVIGEVRPDACSVTVLDQLLVSQVDVREMTYEEIAESGIQVDQDSYSYYNFTLALGVLSQGRQVVIPVALPNIGASDPRPVVGTPKPSIGSSVPVPDVLPVLLKPTIPDGSGLPESDVAQITLPGLIVFPGRIALLHQFFEAVVIVTNGAPEHTPLIVRALRAHIVLPEASNPADNPLRVAELQVGGVVEELELRDLGADGVYGTGDDRSDFAPGQSGQASFLIEGLKEGLHTVTFELEGMLDGLPIGPVPVTGEAFGAVLVRDASFGVTFTHPGTVRAGQEYDLAMTLFNSGSRDVLGAFAELSAASVSGADLVGEAGPTARRDFATTIEPGQSATVKWRLRARVTGAVTASYAKVDGASTLGLALVTGVGDRNVPLSPESLILPDPVKYLPSPVADASIALLGQAWSVAVAPSGSLPEGVSSVSKAVVLDHAVELGIAGLRVRFGEPLEISLVTLLRDWLGEAQGTAQAGFDGALCAAEAGYAWQDEVGAQLAAAFGASAPAQFHQRLAENELARSRFLSVLVAQAEATPVVDARLVDPDGNTAGLSTQGRSGAIGSAVALRLGSDSATRGAFLLASQPASGNWRLDLETLRSGAVSVSMLLPIDDDIYRRISFPALTVEQGSVYRVSFNPYVSSTANVERCVSEVCAVVPITPGVDEIRTPAPKLEGAVQVTPAILEAGDRFGRLIALLFSKPMDTTKGEDPASYAIGGGALVGSNPPVHVGGAIQIAGAKLNFDNRFVLIGLSSPVGPFIERTISASGLVDTRGATLSPAAVDVPIEMTVSPGGTPPGGYLTGRALEADGAPVAGAGISLQDRPCQSPALVGLAAATSGVDGGYAFDYVVDGACSPVTVAAIHPVTSAQKRLSTPVAYHGQHLTVDLIFLGRGSVQGSVTYLGQPVAGGYVQILPSQDPTSGALVRSDGVGAFFAPGIPVGPFSVFAVGSDDLANATGFGAGVVTGPNQTATVNVTLQNVSGSIEGRVFKANGSVAPGVLALARAALPGITDPVTLGYSYTGPDGAFRLDHLPLASITLESRDYVSGSFASQVVQLTSQAPSVSGVVLTLPGNGAVSGRVINQAGYFVAGAEVRSGAAIVSSDMLGYYTIPGLPAGTRTITATNLESGISASRAVVIVAGQEVTDFDLVVPDASRLRGVVSIVSAPGQPAVPLAGVRVTYDGHTIALTDALGAYSLDSVPPDRAFTLRVVDATGRLALNQAVRLNIGETLVRNFTFHPATLTGKIFQPDGQTGAVARVLVYAPQPVLSSGDMFGLITLKAPINTVSVADGSYEVGSLNPANFRVTAYNSFFPTRVSRLGVLPPDGIVTCDLVLVDTLAGKVQGTVFQPDGTTPVGADVSVTLGGGDLADAIVRTDGAGHYEFPEVFPSGNYELTAVDPGTGFSGRVRISTQRNEDMLADIRLLGLGAIQVQVVDAAGTPVESGAVRLEGVDYPNATSLAELTAGGVVLFENMPEGAYAVAASRESLSGRVSVVIPLNQTVSATVRLQACGTISGQVLMPDGVTPAGLADVRLVVDGKTVGFTTSSENEGAFTFASVPVGDFRLEAFDNRSTRLGRTAGTLTEQGQEITADITLTAVGTVRGQVTANSAPVDHALVTIRAGEIGFSYTSLKATTDADGNYSFSAIPVGKFRVVATHPVSRLTGSAEDVLSGATEPLPDKVVNIPLESSASIEGQVLDHGGVAVGGAQVTATVGARKLETTSRENGSFRIDFAPLGEAYVRAEAPTGNDRGMAGPIVLDEPGETQQVEVRFNGLGVVRGDAFDSDGITPLALGTVTLTNSDWSPAVILSVSVRNGQYEIQGAPAGGFSLKLVVPGRTAAGGANGELEADQTLVLPLVLEPAGAITGSVVKTDGATPAVGVDVIAKVTGQTGGILTLVAHTNAAGAFRFDQVPLGTINLSVDDPDSDAIAAAKGLELSTNGQILNVPPLVLDDQPIAVVAVSPPTGALNVPTDTVITITFSEPADPATVTVSAIDLLRGGIDLGGSVVLSPDGRTVTLTPPISLMDSATHTIVVRTTIKDLAGWRLPAEFRSTFTTRDETPPVVSAVDPAWNVTGVPTDKLITVTFNEALDPEQSFGAGVIKLFPVNEPQALVPLSCALDATGSAVTATPTTQLAESTRYRLEVTGERDVAGNIQTSLFYSLFSTVDLTAPTVDSVSVEGQTLSNATPEIVVHYSDDFSGVDTSSLVLELDGQDIRAGAQITSTQARYQVPEATPLARGPHALDIRVSDQAGNQSQMRHAEFRVDDTPPQILSFTLAGQPIFDGMTVTIFRPFFRATYSDASGIDTARTRLLLGPEAGPLVEVAASVASGELTYLPDADLTQGAMAAELVLFDTLGNSASTGVIRFLVDVDAPGVVDMAPLSGSQHGGTTVVIQGERLFQPDGAAPVITIGGNPVTVLSAVAGAPDVITILTPPGVPGSALIQIATERGVGTAVFIYEADSRTPFAIESDTLLLWHLDEPYDGATAVLDSGPLSLAAASSASSTVASGRFGLARSGLVSSSANEPLLGIGSSSFTLEFWVRTAPVPRTYILVGKRPRNTAGAYGVLLTPAGVLRGYLLDNASRTWQAETVFPATVVDDNLWHYVAMTVDREAGRLSLYVDGLEAASSLPPAGFDGLASTSALFAGTYDTTDGSSGPIEFPGQLDEVRLSLTAHSASRIVEIALGQDGPLATEVTRLAPDRLVRGLQQEVHVHGYNLAGVEAQVFDASGAPLAAQVLGSSATEARILVDVSSEGPLGEAQLQLTSSRGTATAALPILDPVRSSPALGNDTLLLLRMDEADGQTTLQDSGPFSLNAVTVLPENPTAYEGLFGNARAATLQTGADLGLLDFTDESFTVETWIKVRPNETASIGLRNSSLGYLSWGLEVTASGTLQATLRDVDGRTATAAVSPIFVDSQSGRPTIRPLDDGQWRHVAMTLDRTTSVLKLYVDGDLRQSTALPSAFGLLSSSASGNYYVRVSSSNADQGAVLLDEVRISAGTRSDAQILEDYSGAHAFGVASVTPFTVILQQPVSRGVPVPVTVNGYELQAAEAWVRRGVDPLNVAVTVSARSYGRLDLVLDVAPEVALGPAELVLVSPTYGEVAAPIKIIDSRPLHVQADTALLFRMDEPGDGAVYLQDESGLGLRAQTGVSSTSVVGRFGLARRRAWVDAASDLGSLDFGAHSFTAEAWVKLPSAYSSAAAIVGRGANYGENNLDWGLLLLKSGGLRALFRDTANTLFQFDLERLRYESGSLRKTVLTDGEWHFLSLVMNRESGVAEIYVDGARQASAAIPAGFGAIRSASGASLQFGYLGSASGPASSDGITDEIRLSATAHSLAEIWQDFASIGVYQIASVSPTELKRDRTQVSVTELEIEGFKLQGLTAEVRRDGAPLSGVSVQVLEASEAEARLAISVGPDISLGNAELALIAQDASTRSAPLKVVGPGPLPRQPDTAVLWRMESSQNGAVSLPDASPFRIAGTADVSSTSDAGRFGFGRRAAAIVGGADYGAAEMGWSSFTLECWMRSGPVGRAYILAGRSTATGANPKYGLSVLPSGVIRAWANDTAARKWKVEVAPVTLGADGSFSVKPILDDRWHLISMIVDRSAGAMTVYIDGEQRDSALAPADFAAIPVGEVFRAGYADAQEAGMVYGGTGFPGVIDDVRLSTALHSAAQLAEGFFGVEAPAVTAVTPATLARGNPSASLTIHGLGLAGVTAQSETPSVGAVTVTTSPSQADLLITIPADTPAGPVRLLLTDPLGATGYAQFTVTAPQPFANPSPTDYDTLALWRLDDDRSGAVTLAGSGDDIPTPVGATSAAASLPVADGRFSYARTKANLVATAGFDGYDPAGGSFAVECWVRTQPVTRAYTLVGRSDVDGANPEFSLTLFLTGALQAVVYDAANLAWQVEAPMARYDQTTGAWVRCLIQDGQWHLVSMVVDRSTEQLRLYVDGDLVASGAAPTGFSTLRDNSKRVRAGHRNTRITGGTGAAEFPGDLDEIRVLAGLRTVDQIQADFGLPAAEPPSGLRIALEDEPAKRIPAELAAAAAGSSRQDKPFENAETGAGETLLLWPLDEPANGAVRIQGRGDAVPEVIGGTAGPESVAEAGRFAGGRASAAIVADPDGGAFDFAASDFTLEFWLRTDPVTSTYTLVGRDGPRGENKDFGVSLLPSGRLRAWVFDDAGAEWVAESEVRVDDSAWRLVGLVVNREAGVLRLTINGEAIAETPEPEGFGAIRDQGERLRAGHIDLYGPVVFLGPEAFPGVLDDVRIVKPAEVGR